MAMGANFSFELTFNETCAPKFNGHNNSFQASVIYLLNRGGIKSGLWTRELGQTLFVSMLTNPDLNIKFSTIGTKIDL